MIPTYLVPQGPKQVQEPRFKGVTTPNSRAPVPSPQAFPTFTCPTQALLDKEVPE